MKKYQKYYMQEFVRTFLRKESQTSWLECALSPKADDLSGLSAWDFWDEDKVDLSLCKEWRKDLQNLKGEPIIQGILSRICVVVRLGHDQVGIEICMLSEVLHREIYILEGIVIVDPRNLALVFNHDGEIVICTRG